MWGKKEVDGHCTELRAGHLRLVDSRPLLCGDGVCVCVGGVCVQVCVIKMEKESVL